MIDQLFDRTYRSGRADLNAGIDRLVGRFAKAAGNAFRVLNRIEYNAPWQERGRGRKHA